MALRIRCYLRSKIDPGLGDYAIGVSFHPKDATDLLALRQTESKFLEIKTDEWVVVLGITLASERSDCY